MIGVWICLELDFDLGVIGGIGWNFMGLLGGLMSIFLVLSSGRPNA